MKRPQNNCSRRNVVSEVPPVAARRFLSRGLHTIRKRHSVTGILFAIALLFAGCTSPARRLEVNAVKGIAPGTTTRADVERTFGTPREFVIGPTPFTVAKYFYRELIPSRDANVYERRLRPADILVRSLSVRYDTNGVVVQKLHDESLNPVRRSPTGWLEIGPFLEPAALSSIIKTNMTRSDLVMRFGEPLTTVLEASGRTVLIWFYLKDRADHSVRPEGRELHVLLNENGRVANYQMAEYDPRDWSWF